VDVVEVDGGRVCFEVLGAGPGIVVPSCNVPWFGTGLVARLAERRTVVVVAPRGYGPSSRPLAAYTAEMLGADLRGVVAAAGLSRCAVLGYSLTGAMAAWWAAATDVVDAVVCGGFPLDCDLAGLVRGAETDVAALPDDPGFDPAAAMAFYRHVAAGAPGALLEGVRCPLLCFWGGSDEVLERFGDVHRFAAALERRGTQSLVLPDLDHLGALLAAEQLVPEIVDWLDVVTPTA
jgi:pimeloyl-ACP methyl ester carboxylesterase